MPSVGGGVITRLRKVEIFRNAGYDVTVVTPNYENKTIICSENLIKIPYLNNKIDLWFENFGGSRGADVQTPRIRRIQGRQAQDAS